jgi:chromosome segregation ATPase
MSEEPTNLVLLKLEEIRKEQARTNDNVGALANSIVSMRREFERAHADIQRDLTSLRSSVSALVVSVDDHTHRLDKIEAHNTQLDTRLEQIEKKLDRIHA